MAINLKKNSSAPIALFKPSKLDLVRHLNNEFVAPHLVMSFIPIQIVTFTEENPLNCWSEGRIEARQTGPVALIEHPDDDTFYLGLRAGKLEAVAAHQVIAAITQSTNN